MRIPRRDSCVVVLLATLESAAGVSFGQANSNLRTYFTQDVGLKTEQIAAIRSGKATAIKLPSRTPAEILVFGAVYIHGSPDAYLKLSTDYEHMRKLPGYLAIAPFSTPPEAADVKDFALEKDDVDALKHCKPTDCEVQLPASAIEELKKTLDWSSPDLEKRLNEYARGKVIERLIAYQRDGNAALGTYNDKEHPTEVPEQFKYVLSYAKALPRYLPDFYNYLLEYPKEKPANTEDSFYWAKVAFGLKPTMRLVHVVTLHGESGGSPLYAIAEKQIYSSHYFQTALDLTFCIPETNEGEAPGFYLVKVMGSEQAGLTGVKGSIVRKVAVDRSANSLQKSLAAIKDAIEHDGATAP
ncbi:MAG TPA: hypothetical protein VFO34_04280 [Candidatus Acidoferrales bacterium]|nr:hypothetical protein [Candidatus Acidoferrales bacterium]